VRSLEWLTHFASLPRLPPLMSVPLLNHKKNVWEGSSGLTGCISSASSEVMRWPRYSGICVPAGMSLAANTPLPCKVDFFTVCQGGVFCVIVLRRVGQRKGNKLTESIILCNIQA